MTGGYGFEMVDGLKAIRGIDINRKFTPNRTERFFRKSFPI
jgi:hypothetical protein